MAKKLGDLGYKIPNTTVGTTLKWMEFSLQQNKKYIECGDLGPGRDPRLRYIASGSVRFIGNGFSTISVDTR